MALTLSSLATNVKSAFQNHSGSIGNTTVAGLVFSLNAVVQSEDFFQCPSDNFVFYSSCFFISPALFLFMATIFLDSGFWDHVRGCCYYEGTYKRGAKRYCCEHSEVSQAWSLHACWTRMLYNDRLETIDNSQSTNSAKMLKIFNVYSSLGL